MMQIIKDICDFGFRRSGTPPAAKTEKYIYDKLKDVGLKDVKSETLDFTRWWSEKNELTIISNKTPGVLKDQIIETFPVWFSGSTPPEGITAEVIYVGYGTKSDFDQVDVSNKIALIDGKMIHNIFPTHNMFDTIIKAKRRGAIAAIITNNSPLDSISYIMRDTKTFPVLSISTPDGIYLKHLCTRYYQKLYVKFTLISKKGPATSNTIIGTLPGKTEDIILVGTHTDSTFTGAIDNATGNSGLITIAEYYAKIPLEKREKTMIFAAWTGHECGSIGSKLFAEMHEDILSKITTFILLDGFGCNGYYNEGNGGIVPTNFDERRVLLVTQNKVLLSFVLDSVMKYKLLPASYLSERFNIVADLPAFVSKKVPSILIIGKPILYHTKLDTIETLNPDQLERSAKAHIEIIDSIQSTPTEIIRANDRKVFDINEFITKNDKATHPSVSFYVIPEILTVGERAIFVPSVMLSPESIILSYKWDFDDGTTSDQVLEVRTFRKPGSYNVAYSIKDNFGNTSESTRVVRVLEKFT